MLRYGAGVQKIPKETFGTVAALRRLRNTVETTFYLIPNLDSNRRRGLAGCFDPL
jgi:hypothetical protein